MTTFLASLVARSRGEDVGLRPLVPSRFEPVPDGPSIPGMPEMLVENEVESEASAEPLRRKTDEPNSQMDVSHSRPLPHEKPANPDHHQSIRSPHPIEADQEAPREARQNTGQTRTLVRTASSQPAGLAGCPARIATKITPILGRKSAKHS